MPSLCQIGKMVISLQGMLLKITILGDDHVKPHSLLSDSTFKILYLHKGLDGVPKSLTINLKTFAP